MTTHTPGPWNTSSIGYATRVNRLDGWAICEGPNTADARLIAAAPDLLAACKAALDNLMPVYATDHLVMRSLRAAIVKAEGTS